MRVLVFSNLWPSSAAPTHGGFVRDRVARLAKRMGFDYRVIHPLPLYPPLPGDGLAARHSRLPQRETLEGVEIAYPRYLHVPRYGIGRQALRMARGARKTFQAAVDEFRPDLVDAHYLYPDGCAAVTLAREAGLPCFVTARGTDANLLPRYPAVRRQMQEVLPGARRLLAVSQALAQRVAEVVGVAPDAVLPMPSGVDLELFQPGTRTRRLFTVARLLPGKRIDLLIRALAVDPALPELEVLGGGPQESRLRALASELGVADRVQLHGEVGREAVAAQLAKGGIFAFPSAREGWPNAVLEALASGLFVVASAVGGIPEILAEGEGGTLVPDTAGPDVWARELASAVRAFDADAAALQRGARARALMLSWDRTLERLALEFQGALR